MLMALCSACRGSELRAADIGLMVDAGPEFCFEIVALTKTKKRAVKSKFSLVFEQYSQEPVLDVVSAIRTYVARTEQWRPPASGKLQLFFTTAKPHGPVVTCTVARWLMVLMGDAGIDTSIYKAHSTRAASTSNAMTQGLLVEKITQWANWSRATTFLKFYNKRVVKSEGFQSKVLS